MKIASGTPATDASENADATTPVAVPAPSGGNTSPMIDWTIALSEPPKAPGQPRGRSAAASSRARAARERRDGKQREEDQQHRLRFIRSTYSALMKPKIAAEKL
jgi:hypothetical protein